MHLRRCQRLAGAAAVAVTAIGAIVLAGWLLDVARLRGPIPGLIEMKANTAIGLVLLGSALWILRGEHAGKGWRRVAWACAAVALLIGLLSLAEYLLGRNLGIDELLFSDPPESAADPTVHPGRLAVQTAIGFVSAGIALMVLDQGRRPSSAAEGLTVFAAALSFFALLGYVYANGNLNAVAALHPIAVHTAVALLVLCAGILLARPERGVVRALRAQGPGSDLASLLLPILFVGLPVIGWLRVQGEHAGLYDSETGVALMIVVFLALLSAGLVTTALRLNRSDHARRESGALLQALIDNAPSVIYIKDTKGRYMLVNRGFQELVGHSAAELGSMSDRDLLTDEGYDHVHANDLAVMHSNTPRQLEVTAPLKGDEQRTFMSVVFPLTDAGGEVTGVCGIANDITERKRAEQEMERARAEAEQANRAKSEFLSRMSHELRTPLAAVIGFGQLLEMGDLNERQRLSVEQILKGGQHLLDLINELLDISRIETGKLTISIEPVSVRSVLKGVVPMVEPLAAARGIAVDAPIDETYHYVHGDFQRLKQVVLNLLSNAVKYNCDGGRVTVSVEEHGDRTRISVGDTGAGIPGESIERAFAPFERLAAGEETEGTGLGLALSRGLVEAMGGRITVESELGHGSVFSVELTTVEAAAAHQEPVTPASAVELLQVERPCKVLYVEDNPANLKLVEQALAEHPAVELLTAMQGGLGLELALEHTPDLVLLDLNLPDVNGAEVLHRMKRDPRTADIPVLILSADATRSTVAQLLEWGARDYLTKPLDVRQFLGRVAEILRERQTVAS